MRAIARRTKLLTDRLHSLTNVDWSDNPDAARQALAILDSVDSEIDRVAALRNRLLAELDGHHPTFVRGSN